MSKSIKVSPKHGVNPTIPVCAFCGKEKNEIALLGHIGDLRKGEDFEAPRRVILDYEPCDDCKEKWSQGVAIIEVSTTALVPNQPPITDGFYPTGRFIVLDEEAITDGKYKKGDRTLMISDEFTACFRGESNE